MKINKNVIIPILLVCLMLVIGVSYAVWQITLTQADTNIVNTACFKIDFKEEMILI